MRVQVLENTAIPEGYTYIRCDQYSPKQFVQIYTNDDGDVDPYCAEYVNQNKKDVYTISDRIAIREMKMANAVGSMLSITGRFTTKRYKYYSDGSDGGRY